MALTKLRGNIITAGTVSKIELENQTITNDKIADGTIQNAKLASPGASTGKAIAMAIVFG